jgi:guanylate kinase
MGITPFIITLTGASASGKSYVIEKIAEVSNDFFAGNILFTPIPFPKYTTREYRASEIAKKQQGEFVDVISVDDIPNDCDLVYGTYGKEYGLRTKDLAERLKNGEWPMVVINDVRAVEELKKVFEGRALSLFLFRHVPNFEEFKEETIKRGNVSDKELLERYIKATALYRIYIENITIFDRVILNVKDEKDDEHKCTKLQTKNIIKGIFEGKISLNDNLLKGVKLFVLSGNNASGKDDVNLAIQKMGKLQAAVISKYTSRRQEKDDANEMICQFIPRTDKVESYKTEYSVEYQRISEYYSQKMPQSFIDDCRTRYKKNEKETFVDFCNVQWDIQRLKQLRDLQKPLSRFWKEQNDNIEYFQNNGKYVNLDELLKKSQAYNPKANEELCYEAKHNNAEYIIYKNHGKQVVYGFSIDGLLQNMQNDRKHRVLVASFVNIFEYCKNKIGNNNVVPIFAYSQISKSDYDKQVKSNIEKLKSQSYDDLIRYSENIVDFEHVIIYAETQMQNDSGGQKEELIDQMFRLFRAYNYQIDTYETKE